MDRTAGAKGSGRRTEDGAGDRGSDSGKPADTPLPAHLVREILDLLPDLVYLVDPEGRFVYLNGAVEALGYDPGELIGRHYSELLHPEDVARVSRDRVLPAIAGVPTGDAPAPRLFDERRGGRRRTDDLRVRLLRRTPAGAATADSGCMRAEIRAAGLHERRDGASERFLGTLGVVRDVTDRAEREAELERRRGELEALLGIRTEELERSFLERDRWKEICLHAQKMESLGRLAGGVAHDFNNLLTVILGYAETIRDGFPEEHPDLGKIDEILRAGRRATELTRRLLAFARREDATPRTVDPNRSVTGALKMLRRLIGAHIELIWSPEEGLPAVSIDPAQLDQILVNLCVNARDAVGAGGRIEISTRLARACPHGSREIPPAPAGPFVEIRVADDGCGMGRDTIDRIFEPFFTTKGLGDGTGLGLAIVYGIVVQNGGVVRVESEPGRGSSFGILLPARAEPATGETIDGAEFDPRPSALADETILVVEDDPALLDLTRGILEELGYRIVCAGSSDEALAAAESSPRGFALLLTDLVLPGLDGVSLAGRMRRVDPDLPVVYMSGHDERTAGELGIPAAARFLRKPFSRAAVADAVRSAIDRA